MRKKKIEKFNTDRPVTVNDLLAIAMIIERETVRNVVARIYVGLFVLCAVVALVGLLVLL